ncbi:MAG: family N-acetyltransferase [Myxococcales bacterium]|nr:family N-acetyltransferase [Myxococcales bacterium]
MIRRARQEDWAAASALWRDADELHASLAPAYFRASPHAEHEWKALLAAGEAATFVAAGERGDAGLDGFGVVRIHDTPPDPAMVPLRRGHVEILVVARAARRRGLGRRLMTELGAWARRQGAAELVLTVWAGNVEAEAFYERLGYRVLSRALRVPL